MALLLIGFLFGFAAGYTMLRLKAGKHLRPWEQKILPSAGWLLMSASFAFAALLLMLAVFGAPS